MRKVILTERDRALLDLLALHRMLSVDDVADELYAVNPFTGEANANRRRACERRLTALRKEGLIQFSRIRRDDGKRVTVIRLAAKADSPLDERASRRRVAARDQSHHVRTIEAVRSTAASYEARGGRVLSFKVEAAIRADATRGRRTARGDAFESFPDAVCNVVTKDAAGRARTSRVAVEYVTSKYTSADIAEKGRSFRSAYDDAVWFADSPRTAERVRRITGAPCVVLS